MVLYERTVKELVLVQTEREGRLKKAPRQRIASSGGGKEEFARLQQPNTPRPRVQKGSGGKKEQKRFPLFKKRNSGG